MRGGPGTKLIMVGVVGLFLVGVFDLISIFPLFFAAVASQGAQKVYSYLTIAALIMDIVTALVGLRYAHNRYMARLLQGFGAALLALQGVRLVFCLLSPNIVPVMLVALALAVVYFIGACRNRIPAGDEDTQ